MASDGTNCKEFFIVVDNITDQIWNTNKLFSHIAKIRRLREIRVLTGFSRGKGSKDIAADVGSERDWLPSIEAFGEGIYFELNQETITNYLNENNKEFSDLVKGQQNQLEKMKGESFLDIPDAISVPTSNIAW